MATVTAFGVNDFIGDSYPIYLTADDGRSLMLMGNEFKKTEQPTDEQSK